MLKASGSYVEAAAESQQLLALGKCEAMSDIVEPLVAPVQQIADASERGVLRFFCESMARH